MRSDGVAMWAGLECTLNRIGDSYHNQCLKNGHVDRLEDLALFAELGVERLRYPCLWELVCPERADEYHWSYLDERLSEMRRLGLTPIAGLVHHGSGPRFTSLIDLEFPMKLARYARAFAERYPWIEDYTPINEPLTTARFSGLYGFWYPHHRSDHSFLLATFLQTQATLLAMEEIRRVNPRARLIQTEDLGRASSTLAIRKQCRFENERRWLSLDMLTGRLDRSHHLYRYVRHFGITDERQEWLKAHARAPDVFGINHYLLSNRFLDHERRHYPVGLHSHNQSRRYADVGAVDSGRVTPPTPKSVFREAWERYHLPIAITEAHVLGPRESQMRWLKQIWEAAVELRGEGADVRAVTAWSLLGSFDWNSLCTRNDGFYEPGVFDLRCHPPRPRRTVISRMISALARQKNFEHPVLDQPGWWLTPRRALFAPDALGTTGERPSLLNATDSRPLLIAGAGGLLGQAFARVCEERGLAYRSLSRNEMDIANTPLVETALDQIRPWAVINAAGYVNVDAAEAEHERCFRENAVGAGVLARAAADRGLPLVTFSSDLVFDGESNTPYTESARVCPLNVYGRSKAECEQSVLSAHPNALIIRSSGFFGPWDEGNFVTTALRRMAARTPVTLASDVCFSPTYVPDLVNAALDLLLDGERGLLHLTNRGQVSNAEITRAAAASAHLNPDLIVEQALCEFHLAARRPRHSVLASERVNLLPDLNDALSRYVHERQQTMGGFV